MPRFFAPALLFWLLLPIVAHAQGIGAFLTLQSAPVYPEGPARGPELEVPAERAYNVVDVAQGDGTIWYRVILADREQPYSAEGWVTLEPHEIRERGSSAVTVFRRVPEPRTDEQETLVETVSVPATALELVGPDQASEAFAPLRWHKVRYRTHRPVRGWLRDEAGIFRPGKDAAFLARVHRETVGQSLDKSRRLRLLSGVVHVGDRPREVEWALGSPTRVTEEEISGVGRATWQYPSVQVVFEDAVVQQID